MDSHSILSQMGMHTHIYTHMESGLNQSYVQKAGGYSRELTVNYKNTFLLLVTATFNFTLNLDH